MPYFITKWRESSPFEMEGIQIPAPKKQPNCRESSSFEMEGIQIPAYGQKSNPIAENPLYLKWRGSKFPFTAKKTTQLQRILSI
jgi:hypothetical protein